MPKIFLFLFFSILHIFHDAHVILSLGRTVNVIFRSPFKCSTLNIFLYYLYQVVHWAHQETKKSAFYTETLIFKIMIMIAHICIRCDCFETLSHLIIRANLQMRDWQRLLGVCKWPFPFLSLAQIHGIFQSPWQPPWQLSELTTEFSLTGCEQNDVCWSKSNS